MAYSQDAFPKLKTLVDGGFIVKITVFLNGEDSYEMIVTKVDKSKKLVTGFVFCDTLELKESISRYGRTILKTSNMNIDESTESAMRISH